VKSAYIALALLICALPAAAQTSTPKGNVEEGKKAWGVALRCQNCHGSEAQGGFGPDLAGRGLSFEQFRHAVREPWGVMLAYTERQLSDQTVADMWAYTSSLSKVAQPAKRTYSAPHGAPLGQVYLVETIGCANCHEPELRQPRRVLGGEAGEVDYEFFANLIYRHTDTFPTGRMGNYPGTRIPDTVLRELFRFVKDDLRLLVPMTATFNAAGVPSGGNTTYSLAVKNTGKAGKGLSAEDVTITLKLPPGAKVVSATGPGTQSASAGAALWKVAKIAPQQELKYSITLAGSPGAPADVFKDSRVDYMKPTMRNGAPNLELVDERWLGSKNDWYPITVAPPAPPTTARVSQ
jgi:cytochrome c553